MSQNRPLGKVMTVHEGIFQAFRLMFSATFFTIILGMATNKIIALATGPDGIAVVGLYRYLVGSIVTILSVGMTTVIVQRISTTASDVEVGKLVRSALLLLVVQIACILILSLFFADSMAKLIFAPMIFESHVAEVRIVLVMAIGILVMQTMVALLNGKVNIKRITLINVATSLATFAMVYPLLELGHMGLALIVGSGSLVGACIATVFMAQAYGLKLGIPEASVDLFKRFSTFPLSGHLIFHPIIITGTSMILQVVISRHYGFTGLGYYNAVGAIENASLAIIMSSLRTYFLPTLGKFESQTEKAEFVNRVITMILISVMPLIIGLILGSKYILWILFSEDFVPASNLVALQSLAMLIHAYTWCYAFYLNHKARYGIYICIDAIWASMLLGGTWYVSTNNYPLIAVVLVYLGACILYFSIYLLVIFKLYGRGMLQARNVKIGATILGLTIPAYFVSEADAVVMQFCMFCIVCGYAVHLLRKNFSHSQLVPSAN
jgi:PST family polysaccharide transporter